VGACWEDCQRHVHIQALSSSTSSYEALRGMAKGCLMSISDHLCWHCRLVNIHFHISAPESATDQPLWVGHEVELKLMACLVSSKLPPIHHLQPCGSKASGRRSVRLEDTQWRDAARAATSEPSQVIPEMLVRTCCNQLRSWGGPGLTAWL
jgi:hypothetical protein